MTSARATPWSGQAVQLTGNFLMARVQGLDGTAVTQASISTITYTVSDLSTAPPTLVAGPTSLTVTDVIWDVLQTDNRWDRDEVGYNFGVQMPAASYPHGGRVYRVVFKVTPVLGAAFFGLMYDLNTQALPGESF